MDSSGEWGRLSRRLASVAAVAGCTLVAACVDVANAGTYHVYGCRTPGGAAAANDGWNGSYTGQYAYYGSGCQSGGSLYAQLGGAASHPFGDVAREVFSAPAGTDIAAATLWRYEMSSAGQAYGAPGTVIEWLNASGGPTVADQCNLTAYGCSSRGDNSNVTSAGNEVTGSSLSGVTGIDAEASCGGGAGGTCPATGSPPAAEIDVYASDVTLRDLSSPTTSAIQGSLVNGGTLAGTESMSFSASDTGSGVYSAIIDVDGQQFARDILDTNGGRCADQGGTTDGTHAFQYIVPCKLSLSPSIALDTTQLTGGTHHLEVLVDDAAGNASTAYDGQISVNNGPTDISRPQITDANGGQSIAVGDTLNVASGQWNPTPTSFSYAWQTCAADGTACQPTVNASGPSYSVSPSDAGKRLLVTVTAHTTHGTTSANTDYTPVVQTASSSGAGASSAGLQGAITGPGPSGGDPLPGAGGGSTALAHIANGSSPCGSPTLALRFGKTATATVGYGKTATLHGELTCGGAPVRGAVVSVASVPTAGSVAASAGEATTAHDGTFAYVPPSGPSRNITATYKAYADDAQPVATATATLSVTPQIVLRITPRNTRNHRRITWRGTVNGGPIPKAGLPLDLQYRDGKRWRTFDQIRTKSSGKFNYRYTFQRTTHATVYAFRVTIPRGGVVGYPYAPGSSARRSVRVRP